LIGLNGPVTVRRARFWCSKSQQSLYPLDEALDLPAADVTVGLARRSLRLATHMSFSALQEELYYQHEVRLSGTMLDRLMQSVGQVAENEQQAAVAELEHLSEGVGREECSLAKASIARPKRLYVSCDGILYPTRYRQDRGEGDGGKRISYQEMKCGAVFWREGDSAWHKRAAASRENVDRFGLRLWDLAVRCGMLQADEVIYISDGGTWPDSVAKGPFRDAIRILDWYHASEHIWETARALYPDDERAATRWAKQCEGVLWESSGIGLLHHLERSRCVRASDAPVERMKALDSLIEYVRPRLAIMDYVEYRAKGYVIGSGMMESTCKQVVGRRLKGNGRQWSETGALAMTALTVHRLNHTWEAFWESRPLHRVA